MITSSAQQVLATLLRLVRVASRHHYHEASSACPTDPMRNAFLALHGRCQAESVDEARRMLMNEYVKQLATTKASSRFIFWRRHKATGRSLGRRAALAAYKQTKPYAQQLVSGSVV